MAQTNASIDRLADAYGDDYYFDEAFLIILQSYIPLIRQGNVVTLTPTNQQLYKYQGDFYGLLDELGVQKQYHYATLLLNNLRNSSDFDSSMASILVPDYSQIDMIHATYTTLTTT